MAPKKRIATKALRKGLSYAVVALLGVLLVSGLQLFKEKRATEPAGALFANMCGPVGVSWRI